MGVFSVSLLARIPQSIRDVAWNMSGALITGVLLLVLAPLYIQQLGLERYGVLSVVWALLGYFGFLDLGLSRAAANFSARAASDSEIATIYSTTLCFNLVLGIAGAAVFALISAALFRGVVKASPQVLAELLNSRYWIAAFLPFGTSAGVFTGILEGRGNFALSNQIQTIGSIAFQTTPIVAAFYFGPRLDFIIPCALLARALAISMSGFLTARLFHVTHLSGFDRALLRRLFSFGSWVTVSGVISPLLATADQFAISATIGVSKLPFYSVSNSVVQRILIVPYAMFRALSPRFAQADKADALAMLDRSVRLLALLLTLLVSVGILVARPGLSIWLGESFAAKAALPAEVLLFGVWFNGLAMLPYVHLEGHGRPDIPAKLHLLELPAYALLLLLGLHFAGIAGAAAASALRMLIDAFLLFYKSGCARETIKAVLPGLLLVSCCLVCSQFEMSLFVTFITITAALAISMWWGSHTLRSMGTWQRIQR